ncbi:MAG: TolC family protein [Gemmatimonadetes bacterium]|nr:TolC family protein [Gemmatimonadota bacterium]
MRRIASLVLGLSAIGTQAMAQAAGPVLTLQEAVDLAVRNNPTYLQSTTGRTRAGAAVRSAYGNLLPNVNTSFGSSYREGRQQFFAGQAFGSTSDVLSSSSDLNISAQYSRQSFLGIKQQKANLEAAEADVTNAAAQLRMNVITQYLNVLQAQARAAFQDTLLVSTQAQLELARARLQVGAAISLDVRRAEVQVGQAQVGRLREQNSAELEKLRLFQQIGVEQPANVQLTTTFGIEEPKVQLQEVMDLARRSNPALQALQSRQRAADVAVSSARASYLPTLSLQTGLSGFSQQLTNLDGQIQQAQSQAAGSRASCFTTDSLRRGAGMSSIGAVCNKIVFTPAQEALLRDANAQFPFKFTRSPINFGMQVSLPIFDGFQREQRVQEAAAQRSDTRYRLREQELRLTTEVTSAYRNLTTAYQTVRLQEQNATTAREALALAQERFRIGTNTFVEVTQARSDYERAETDRINAIYDFHKAFAALEGAVGRPLR